MSKSNILALVEALREAGQVRIPDGATSVWNPERAKNAAVDTAAKALVAEIEDGPTFDADKAGFGPGDILESRYGYFVQVEENTVGDLEGRLICQPGHACENIPYALNGGKDHRVVAKAAPRRRT